MNCQYCGFPLDEKNLCEHCSNLLTYSFATDAVSWLFYNDAMHFDN